MRSITMKAALAAMIVAVPLAGAFAANGNGGTGGDSHGSTAYQDFSQKRWFDGIDSFHDYQTPVGTKHFDSPYNRSNNRSYER